MNNKNIELIKQALGAAESSIKLAKQLLSEVEGGSAGQQTSTKANGADLPGITGIFDGENMTSESGESYPVPANYASKSMLVVGDTLKLVEEGKNKDKRFKQIEHVKRHKSTGILTKKDGKWKVVTPEGSYKVLGAAVEHFGADIGAEVTLHLPATNLTVAYGAIESVSRKDKLVEEKASESVKTEVEEPKKETQPEPPAKPKVEEPLPSSVEKKPEPKKVHSPVKTEPAKPKPEIKKEPEPKKEAKPVVEPSTPEEKAVTTVPQPPKPEPAPATAPTAPTATSKMEVQPEEEELT